MRVNARLDEQTSQKIDYLTQATGQSVSHVVREAIAAYHVQVRGKQTVPSRFLALAGKGDSGRSDIASNVKDEYFALLMAKHRPQRARR